MTRNTGDNEIVEFRLLVQNLHTSYTFYIKVTQKGGSFAFFGPYTAWTGCPPEVVLPTMADNSIFKATEKTYVGASLQFAYLFYFP